MSLRVQSGALAVNRHHTRVTGQHGGDNRGQGDVVLHPHHAVEGSLSLVSEEESDAWFEVEVLLVQVELLWDFAAFQVVVRSHFCVLPLSELLGFVEGGSLSK